MSREEEDKITVDLGRYRCNDVNRIQVAQNISPWQAFIEADLSLLVS
jgi:hypothetical protein